MRILDDIPVEIDSEEVFRQLHLDIAGPYAVEVNALIESARQVAHPRAVYRPAFVHDIGADADAVTIAETPRDFARPPTAQTRFVSKLLRNNLGEIERVFPYVVTCGRELDSIQLADGDVFGQFCRDTIKEIVLWSALAHLYEHLRERYALGTLSSMNPGDGERNVWPIEQQRELFAFLGDVEESIGVVLTDSCLMVPNKTVSGLYYPSEDGFETCHVCRQSRCRHRRAPFDKRLWVRTFGTES